MELSIQSGKEDGETFSILHLRHTSPFACEATKNEFGQEKRIVCRFATPARETLPPINNAYLTIKGASSANGYTITITPKAKMKLIPLPFDLTKEAQTYRSEVKSASHWSVIGYSKKLPLISPSAPSINFPVKLTRDTLPYVGGLDLKGNPVKISQTEDVADYLQMKKAYEVKNYEKVLELSSYTLKKHPNSVFKNELMVYQIRAQHEKEEYEALLDSAKRFLRDFSSDTNVAEVLAYTANAYGKLGQSADADYFYDRLFKEHADSPHAAAGMIFKARELEAAGSPKRAKMFYQKALEMSLDVDVASQAAFKLAKMELDEGNTEAAKQHVDKILKANPKQFSQVRADAMNMADTFVYRKDHTTGIRITEALLKATEPKTPEHEVLLRNLGLRLAKAQKKSEALKRLNEYLETYKYGDYTEEVRRAKDGLFFEEGESNATDEIGKYDELISRYGSDSVGQKALYKKAQLLLKEKKYNEVLDMEGELHRLDTTEYPKTNEIISQSAIGLEKRYLKEGKCAEAMALQKMYRIKLLPQWDGLLFGCALKTAQYSVAKKIAEPHLTSKPIAERQIWLSRMVKIHFALGEYKKALKGGDELISLLNVEKNPPLNEIHRTMFDAAQRLGDGEGMIRHIKSVEEAFRNDFKEIERYTQMVALGLKRKDEAMVQNYARKVTALQTRTKTYTQTPYIEFTLAQSLQNVGKDAEALRVLKTLDTRKLTPEKRSRQQYLIGALAQSQGQKAQARAAFNASIKADKNSAWAKLAKDALELL